MYAKNSNTDDKPITYKFYLTENGEKIKVTPSNNETITLNNIEGIQNGTNLADIEFTGLDDDLFVKIFGKRIEDPTITQTLEELKVGGELKSKLEKEVEREVKKANTEKVSVKDITGLVNMILDANQVRERET